MEYYKGYKVKTVTEFISHAHLPHVTEDLELPDMEGMSWCEMIEVHKKYQEARVDFKLDKFIERNIIPCISSSGSYILQHSHFMGLPMGAAIDGLRKRGLKVEEKVDKSIIAYNVTKKVAGKTKHKFLFFTWEEAVYEDVKEPVYGPEYIQWVITCPCPEVIK